MKSIMPTEKGKCYMCGSVGFTHEHHVFSGTARRRLSEEHGLKVYLCPDCHRRVHADAKLAQILKKHTEKMWMLENQKTIEDFIKVFGKNYILEGKRDDK